MDEPNLSTQDKANIAAAVKVVREYEALLDDILTGKQLDIGVLTTVMRGPAYDAVAKKLLTALSDGTVTYEGRASVASLTSRGLEPIGGATAIEVVACIDTSKQIYRDKKTGAVVQGENATRRYTDVLTVVQTPDGWFIQGFATDFGKTC